MCVDDDLVKSDPMGIRKVADTLSEGLTISGRSLAQDKSLTQAMLVPGILNFEETQ